MPSLLRRDGRESTRQKARLDLVSLSRAATRLVVSVIWFSHDLNLVLIYGGDGWKHNHRDGSIGGVRVLPLPENLSPES